MDDGEYFQTLPENTIFLFLRANETWRPSGTDFVRSGELGGKSRLTFPIWVIYAGYECDLVLMPIGPKLLVGDLPARLK